MRALTVTAILFLHASACSSKPADAPSAPAPSPAPAPALTPAPAPAPARAADPDEACAQIIAVNYKGVARGGDKATRDRAVAEMRARELLAKARAGDFAAVAQSDSDAPTSAARGGIVGAFRKSDWPELHAALRDTVFGLQVGEIAPEPVSADYGYVIVRRCPVEKARSRHILVRYKGAKNARPEMTRSKAEAEARAREVLQKLTAGADFAALARETSDDDSRERGGDIGARSRGVLALPYEQALFALRPGERSGVVESEFGFHVIERLPDAP